MGIQVASLHLTSKLDVLLKAKLIKFKFILLKLNLNLFYQRKFTDFMKKGINRRDWNPNPVHGMKRAWLKLCILRYFVARVVLVKDTIAIIVIIMSNDERGFFIYFFLI